MGGERPKTLLPVGDHPPLLEHILSGLKTAGVDDVLIVTGFKSAEIEAYVAEHFSDLKVTYTFNARYASWGNFHSVRVALDQSPGMDVLIANSDVIVAPDVYRRVADAAGDLVLAVQERPNLDDEDMAVRIKNKRVVSIGKHLKKTLAQGEYAGVSLVRHEAAKLYGDIANSWEWKGDTGGYYEDVYAAMLEDIEARSVKINEDEYAEVDKPEDLPAAIAVIEALTASSGAPPGE